jgi:hypothetical protein
VKKKYFGIDFKHLKVEGYRNINKIYPQTNQLHACETLFGDWNAKVMILAQDAANFETLDLLLKKNPKENPFRHGEKVKTNLNLFNLLKKTKHFDLGDYLKPNNKKCGVYYANAVWLLKISNSMSGPIVNKEKVFDASKEVIKATLFNLNDLKLIITLGREPFLFLKEVFKNEIMGEWPEVVLKRKLNKFNYQGKEYLVGSIYHTSNRGVISRANKNGFIGKNSKTKGEDLCLEDLREIFSKAKL